MAGNIKGITIELTGETTQLTKALEGVNKKGNSLYRQLREVDRALKFNPGNAELISQKQRLLGEQIKNTKERLDTLKEAHKQAQAQLENGEIGQDQFDALTREIIKAESQLEEYAKELKSLDFSKLDEAAKKLKETGDKTTAVGKNMSKNVTAPIVAVGAGALAAFKTVDEGLDIIVKKTGATNEEMVGFKETFENVYGSIPATAEDVGNAIGEINTQFGLTGPALDEATSYMLKFAEITDSDVTQSTISAKAAMEKYNLEADQLSAVLDAVASEGQRTGVSSERLFDVVTKASPQLKAMNLSFEESVHLMATFEQKGIDSNKALGYMTRAQTKWAKEGKTMNEGLAELAVKLEGATTHEERLAIAAEEFGTRGGAYMLEALDELGIGIEELGASTESSLGTVGETFETTLDPIDQANLAMQNMNIAGAELGGAIQEALLPVMEWLVEKIKAVTEWFQNLSPGMQTAILVIAGVAAAIGPLLVIIGTLISAVGTIMSAFAAAGPVIAAISGPIGWVVAAIVGLIAIGVVLYKNWDAIKAYAVELWGRIRDTFANIAASISNAWNSAKEWTSNAWASFRNTVTGFVDGIRTKISTVFDGIKTKISGVWDSVKSTTKAAWDAVRKFITDPINTARDAVQAAIDKVKSILSGTLSFPKIKLPRFSLTGKFSLMPPSVPRLSIDWYDKGGIFSAPTVIGVGEKRPEFVGALDDLRHLIGDELDKRQGPGIVIQQMVVREEADIKKIALELYKLKYRGV